MIKIAHAERQIELKSAVAEHNDEELTRVARASAKASVDITKTTADAAEDIYETTRQLAKDSPEFGCAFADLLGEQTRESVDTLSTFARAVNWTDVAQAQSKLITSSFLRISQFNARYGAFILRGMTAIPTLSRR